MTAPAKFALWISCADCGAETEYALDKVESAFYDALRPVSFRCRACGGSSAGDVSRQAPLIDAELLDLWMKDEKLHFDADEDQALAFLDADTLILYACRPEASPQKRRALAFGLVEKLALDAFANPGERLLARSFLTERLKLWAAPEKDDGKARTARRRAALEALYAAH
ncbi:MAG: hypothetical protein AAFW46_14775 [Pseudomonadota bacterium]